MRCPFSVAPLRVSHSGDKVRHSTLLRRTFANVRHFIRKCTKADRAYQLSRGRDDTTQRHFHHAQVARKAQGRLILQDLEQLRVS